MRKFIFFVLSAVVLFFVTVQSSFAREEVTEKPTLIIFHSLTCHSCIKVKKEILPVMEQDYRDKINFEYREISDIENYTLLVALQEKHNITLSEDLPVLYLSGSFINGEKTISNGWKQFIENGLNTSTKTGFHTLPSVDLVAKFKSFSPAVIGGAGLIDGINPCAFTVIVFFMSFLALQGYRKNELIIIGLSFIFSVFMTYLLIGIGLFGFLYRMNNFWLITKILNYSIGALCIVLGILAIIDFIKFKRTGKTEGLALQLPKALKDQIHQVIRIQHKVERGKGNTPRPLFKLVLSALISGFLISLLEAVCTGQTYIPTISFILKTTSLKLEAFKYLLLYNFMFVMPLLIIFVLALLGVTSEQFSNFLKKHLLAIKILMAAVFFGLGAFLIIRA